MTAIVLAAPAPARQPVRPSRATRPTAKPDLKQIGIDQQLDAGPARLVFQDEAGRTSGSADYFGKRPVDPGARLLRVPDALHAGAQRPASARCSALTFDAGKEFDVVAVSFDPKRDPELAAQKKQPTSSATAGRDAATGWHFLTGDAASIERARRRRSASATRTTSDRSSTPTPPASMVADARRAHLALLLRHRVLAARPAARPGRSVRASKIGTLVDQVAAALLPLRPHDRQVRRRRDDARPRRRRGDRAGVPGRFCASASTGAGGDATPAPRRSSEPDDVHELSAVSRTGLDRRRPQVDALYFFLLAVTAFFSLLIAGAGRLLRDQVSAADPTTRSARASTARSRSR